MLMVEICGSPSWPLVGLTPMLPLHSPRREPMSAVIFIVSDATPPTDAWIVFAPGISGTRKLKVPFSTDTVRGYPFTLSMMVPTFVFSTVPFTVMTLLVVDVPPPTGVILI